jgi:hypothetical protein
MHERMSVQELFHPIIGEIAWCVARGHGSFLRLEFGQPHLSVREPIAAGAEASSKVRRELARRKVFVLGDFTLWLEYGDWSLHTTAGALDSNMSPSRLRDQCLRDLEGQKLLSVEKTGDDNSLLLTFDLGATLVIKPSRTIVDDVWSLHAWAGPIASYRPDGTIIVESSRPERERD